MTELLTVPKLSNKVGCAEHLFSFWVLICFSRVWLFATLWTEVCQAPLSTWFSGQEYWSGLPCLSPKDLPKPGIKPTSLMSPALTGKFFTTSTTWEAQCHLVVHQPAAIPFCRGSSWPRDWTPVSCILGRFFTIWATREAQFSFCCCCYCCCCCCVASVLSDSVRPHRRQPTRLPSLGFSRQEHWSGLPFPSPMHESEKWKWSRSVESDS